MQWARGLVASIFVIEDFAICLSPHPLCVSVVIIRIPVCTYGCILIHLILFNFSQVSLQQKISCLSLFHIPVQDCRRSWWFTLKAEGLILVNCNSSQLPLITVHHFYIAVNMYFSVLRLHMLYFRKNRDFWQMSYMKWCCWMGWPVRIQYPRRCSKPQTLTGCLTGLPIKRWDWLSLSIWYRYVSSYKKIMFCL